MVSFMNNEYQTSDFYIAAYLKASDIVLLRTDRSNPQKVLFVFTDSKDRQVLTEDFLFGRALTDPRKFISAIKELKQLLYNNYGQ